MQMQNITGFITNLSTLITNERMTAKAKAGIYFAAYLDVIYAGNKGV